MQQLNQIRKTTFKSADKNMGKAYLNAKNKTLNLSIFSYSKADIVVIDLQLDVKKQSGDVNNYSFSFKKFKKAIKEVADNVNENTTIVVETTVPPGTTEKVIHPIFKESFKKRRLDINKLYLANAPKSNARSNYFNSINNYCRFFRY